jgi:MalT-like TPR region
MRSHPILFLIVVIAWTSYGGMLAEDTEQFSASVQRYSLSVKIDVERHTVQGEAQISVRCLRDSLTELRFRFFPPLDFISARDIYDKRFDRRLIELVDGSTEAIVFMEATLRSGDSVLVRLLFEGDFDTTSTSPSYIGRNSFLLTRTGQHPWWPQLIAPMTHPASMADVIVTAPTGVRVFAGGTSDSSKSTERATRWTFTHSAIVPLDRAFMICGISEWTCATSCNADSTLRIHLYTDPSLFNQDLAARVIRELGEASDFFSGVTHRKAPSSDISYVMVGHDDRQWDWQSSANLVIAPNSPAYMQNDTLVTMLSVQNPWVHKLAHYYGFSVTDSLEWMRDAWAGYLSSRFFLSRADSEFQHRERLDLLTRTLDFYPAPPLVSVKLDLESRKGTYVLLMLEYLLGRDLFDNVMKTVCARPTASPLRNEELQRLCEEAYGSSLQWFFKEWLYQSGFPELVLTSDIKQTTRGAYSLQIVISQRGDVFTTPVNIVIVGNSRSITKRLFVREQDQSFEFIIPSKPTKIELDPDYLLLRWIPKIRLYAHAMTAHKYRMYDRDMQNSEQEALLTLKLDPNNHAGWNSVALFALGKLAVIRGDLKKAEDYFRKASTLETTEPAQIFPVISLVRLGNVLEMQDKRDEALQLYQLAVSSGERNSALYAYAIFEAQKYLQKRFVTSDELWYGRY